MINTLNRNYKRIAILSLSKGALMDNRGEA